MLTISEALEMLEHRVSRSTLERAIAAAELPAQRGKGRAGKPAYVLRPEDIRRWYEAKGSSEAVPPLSAGQGANGAAARCSAADDDDDDEVLTTTDYRLGGASASSALAALHREGLEVLAERLEPLQQRLEEQARALGRAEAERDALRTRALAAEDELSRLRARVRALEGALSDEAARRGEGGWLRRLLGGG